MSDLWLAAGEDAESERFQRHLALARTAVADPTAFALGAANSEEFEHRLALVADRFDAAVASVVGDAPTDFLNVRVALLDEVNGDFGRIHAAREAELEAERQRVAARHQAEIEAARKTAAAAQLNAEFAKLTAKRPPSDNSQDEMVNWGSTEDDGELIDWSEEKNKRKIKPLGRDENGKFSTRKVAYGNCPYCGKPGCSPNCPGPQSSTVCPECGAGASVHNGRVRCNDPDGCGYGWDGKGLFDDSHNASRKTAATWQQGHDGFGEYLNPVDTDGRTWVKVEPNANGGATLTVYELAANPEYDADKVLSRQTYPSVEEAKAAWGKTAAKTAGRYQVWDNAGPNHNPGAEGILVFESDFYDLAQNQLASYSEWTGADGVEFVDNEPGAPHRFYRGPGADIVIEGAKTAGRRFSWTWPGTRKPDDMVVFPVTGIDADERIAQGSRSIVRFNINTGEGIANWKGSHSKGFMDLHPMMGAQAVTMPPEFIREALGNEYKPGDAIGGGVFVAAKSWSRTKVAAADREVPTWTSQANGRDLVVIAINQGFTWAVYGEGDEPLAKGRAAKLELAQILAATASAGA